MRVAVTGSGGLIGTAVVSALAARGDEVLRMVRGEVGRSGSNAISWDPTAGVLEARSLEGVDAVVHLAGEGIAEKRWSPEQKRRILDSRVLGTTLLVNRLAEMSSPPAVLVSGSAIGYYGDRGSEILNEASTPGTGFLSEVVQAWEAAAQPAADAGIRVVMIRTGVVLSRRGGALARMVLPFKLGLGGKIGSGRQYLSWIALRDEVGAILHALGAADLEGPVDLTAPNPVTNSEFTSVLGAVLRRPTFLPTPVLPLNMRYGSELVRSLLLEGQRVLPAKLIASGYQFQAGGLADALGLELAR